MHFSWRRAGMMRLALSGLGACWALIAVPSPAAADGDIRASYAVTLVGLPLANATLDLAVRGNLYTARVTYQSTGATRLLSDAAGVAASSGAYRDGRLIPAGFDLDYRNGRRRQKVTLGMAEGVVKTMTIDPPLALTPDQLAIEPGHLNAIADPLSALLIPARDRAQADACDRTLSILDGLRRYDIRLEPHATGSTDRKGFSGPTTICRVVLKPLAGMIGGGANARAAGAEASQIEVTYGRAVALDLHVPISLRALTRYGAVNVALGEFADDAPKPGGSR